MVDRIQNEYMPDVVTAPGETLQEILDTIGMSKAELADRIGKTPKTIGEIIKHGAPITPATSMELEKALGTPASFWNNRERRYRESLARQQERKRLKKEIGWLKTVPVGQMIKAGWIQKHKDKTDQVDEVLDHPEKFTSLREKARETIVDSYSLDDMFQQRLELLNHLLGK